MKNFDRRYLVIILCILLLAGGLLLVKVNREYLGNFGQRQVYNAWVVRNFAREGINIFDAKIDALGYDGKQIPIFMGFPMVISIVAFLCKVTGLSIEFWGRTSSVFFFASTFVVLFFWLRYYFSERTIAFILFIFAFLPMSIIYFQSFILEPAALFFFCLGMLALEKYFRENRSVWMFTASSLLVSLSIATRIQYGILIIPFLYVFFRERGVKTFRDGRFYASIPLALSIPVIWQAVAWNAAIIRQGKSSLAITLKTYPVFADSLFMNAEFYRKLFDDFTQVIFNPVGLTLVIIGLFMWKWEKKNLLFVVYLFSVLLSVLIIPRKFYRHDFYFFPIIVPGSVLAGYCVEKLTENMNKRYAASLILAVFLLASMRYSLHPAFKTPEEEAFYITETETVKKNIPQDEKIVIIGAGPTFLYYSDRKGWILPRSRREDVKRTSQYVRSEGKIPEEPVDILKHYESLGTNYVVVYKSFDSSEVKPVDRHVRRNYKKVKETDKVSVYKKKVK